MNSSYAHDPVLDALRVIADIQPEPAQAERAVERARSVVSTFCTVQARHSRKSGLYRWVFVSLAVVIVVGLMLPFLGAPDGGARLAFADVKKKVLRTNSVQYCETRDNDESEKTKISQVYIFGKHLQRTEHGSNFVLIIDAKAGKYVSMDTRVKTFTILEKQVLVGTDGRQSERRVKPFPQIDFYKRLVTLPDKPKRRLPEKKISDKTVVGFYFEQKTVSATWQRTFWVDPKTKLPVRIEIIWKGKAGGTSTFVLSDFIYNEIKDRRLFSTRPPKGYTVQKGKVIGIAPTSAK